MRVILASNFSDIRAFQQFKTFEKLCGKTEIAIYFERLAFSPVTFRVVRSRIVEASHHYLDTNALNCAGIGRIWDAECVDLQPAINSGRACCHTSAAAEPTAELTSRLIGEVEINGSLMSTDCQIKDLFTCDRHDNESRRMYVEIITAKWITLS